jgi:hypothetical protein
MTQPTKTIGMMNGPWAIMFKLCMLALPLLIMLESWQTVQIFKLQSLMVETGHMQQAIEANTRAINANTDRIATLPPQDWRERIKQLEADMRKNVDDHTTIKLLLADIKAAVVTKPNGQ